MEDITARTEKKFIEASCDHGVRSDGRDLFDVRCMSVELGVLPQSNASCRLSIGTGTDLICSLKVLEVGEPMPAAVNEGILEVTVEFSPVINPSADKKKLQEQGARIASHLQQSLLSASAIELEKLCIIPGKICWIAHVDILFFQLDGCAVDAASYAAYAVLNTARYPQTELIDGESGTPEDFELSSDLSLARMLPLSRHGVPIVVSVAQIGSSITVDCDGPELACANSLMSFSFDNQGSCCSFRKEAG
ncbi:unnamed protein product, partial [Ectocarpus fasciculatus]